MNPIVGIIIFGLIILFAVILSRSVKDDEEQNNSAVRSVEPIKPTVPSNSYASVENEEVCAKVYYCSTEIVASIRKRIGMDSIVVFLSDNKHQKAIIKKGEILATINFKWREYSATPSTKMTLNEHYRNSQIYSPCDGYVVYHTIPMFATGSTFLVAKIYKEYNILLEKEYPFTYRVETDSFDKTNNLVWEKVNGEEQFQTLSLSSSNFKVSFNLNNNKPIISVWYRYKTTKGTTIELLFDDNTILCFPLFGKKLADGSLIIPVSPADIECFSSKNLLTIRVRKDEVINDYPIAEEEQESLSRFSSAFKQAIEDIAEDKELQEWQEQMDKQPVIEFSVENKKDDSCWVYLMHDYANNAYKIGISNNPEYRERTLQSEKPSIEKLAARKFPTRDIARAFESSLHKVYEGKRLRGEWFKLEPNEVEDIKKALE